MGSSKTGTYARFSFDAPTSTGPTDSLAELKFVSAGVSWYPRGVEGRGTERRASKLPAEYKYKLAVLDRRFHDTSDNETGPLVRRLQSYGELQKMVIGPWADCSKDLHALIKHLGKQRAIAQARERGRPASDRELGHIVGQIRRVLSTTFIRAHQTCLLSRIGFLGAGGMAAGERRAHMMRKEDMYRRERQAIHEAHVRGRGLCRVGLPFV